MNQHPYQFQPQPQRSHGKLILRVLIGLAVIVASAVITVLLIKFFYKTPTPVAPAVKELSSAEMVKKYKDEHKLEGYALNTSMNDSIIPYKLSETPYAVQVSAIDTVQFTRTENSTADDITKAASDSKAFLTTNGLKLADHQPAKDTNWVVYDGQQTVCKTYSSLHPDKKVSSYGLVCTDKKAIVAERDSIKALLDLYTKTGTHADFSSIVQTIHSEGNKRLSLLSAAPTDTTKPPVTLIFASIDGTWSYVGTRVTPSIDVESSFVIPDDLKKAISDPKYDGFLLKYVH